MRLVDIGAIAASGGAGGLTPVFQATFTSSIVPEIGTAGTFARSGTAYYCPTNATVGSKTTNNACVPAYIPGLAGAGGIQIANAAKNYLLYSEDFTNAAWTAVAGGAVSGDTAVAPDGNTTADTISGSTSGDGIAQDTGVAAANGEAWIFSVWLKATSGTPSVTLEIKDAGVQSTTNPVTISTTWKRYAVYRKFTAGPSGNMSVQILVGNTSTVRAWGAQVEGSAKVGGTVDDCWGGIDPYGPYIPTTSAVASQSMDDLYYAGSEITTVYSKATLVAWVYRPAFTDMWTNATLLGLSDGSLGIQMGLSFMSTSYTFQVIYGGGSSQVDTGSAGNAGAWNQIIISSDMDGDAYATYINGASVNTNSTARTPLASVDYLCIGSSYAGGEAATKARTIIGRVELYDSALDSSDASALYDAQKGAYGL